jgi:hypothetical protein
MKKQTKKQQNKFRVVKWFFRLVGFSILTLQPLIEIFTSQAPVSIMLFVGLNIFLGGVIIVSMLELVGHLDAINEK